ncbi:FecR domain-containing protein [Planctomycetales bacterium ZRK34]|nr:FecR domain-containing protein [Planctomycetales bacterium ZRK34]
MTDARLDKLLDAVLESDASADELRELQSLVQSDPEAMARYLDTLELHAAFAWKNIPGHSDQASGPNDQQASTPTLRTTTPVGGQSVWYLSATAAALVALAITAWFLLSPSPQTSTPNASATTSSLPVAMLTDLSSDATFAESAVSMRPGVDLPPGPIRLTAGKAQLMFASTAVVDLKGPCEFEMTGPNRGRLISGTLEAYVRPEAVGFTVDLPGGIRIVDLGTRFAISTKPTGRIAVAVYEGTIRIHRPDVPHRLLAANEVAVIDEGDMRVALIDQPESITLSETVTEQIDGDFGDGRVDNQRQIASQNRTAKSYDRVGIGGESGDLHGSALIYFFKLPEPLDPLALIDADIELTLLGIQETPAFGVDLYAIDVRQTPTIDAEDYSDGPEAAGTLIQDDLATANDSPGAIRLTPDARVRLVRYLHQHAGSSDRYLVVRLNADIVLPTHSADHANEGYRFAFSEGPDSAENRPKLYLKSLR